MKTNLFRSIRNVGLFAVLTGVVAQMALAQQLQTNPTQIDQTNPAAGAAMDTYSGIYQTPWFNEPSIRQQLQMNDAQYDQLNQAYVTNWNRYNARINQIRNDKTLDSQQREDRLEQLNNSFHDSFSNSARSVLADEAARQKYNQMYYQYRGYGAFYDPDVQQKLNLSETQRQSIREAGRQWNRQMGRYNRDYVSDPDVVLKRFNESRSEYSEGLKKILTPQQEEQWREIAGNRFEIPANVYFDNGVTTAKPVLK
ncbi:hypothetical protein [Schlesneria paludicola]|uniref:hypothetical protein n=1 Tax=Schlesneria paludicola TaxID=360056 RepID=UPI00029A7A48|nr:hypothetical protein [Schlesneria paludicola]